MKYILIAFSFLFILIGCSHHVNKHKFSSQMSAFYENWKNENDYLDDDFKNNYHHYLVTVDRLLAKEKAEKKRDLYLSTLLNNSQILTHTENTLSQRYFNEKKRKSVLNPQDFKLYKTKIMSEVHDHLNEARFIKLKKEFGPDLFEQLLSNHRNFNKSSSSELPDFLFPL